MDMSVDKAAEWTKADSISPSINLEFSHPKYRADIDGLRAVAVLSVVAYHAFPSFGGGFIGVDIFFVISGFLISTIVFDNLQRGTFSFVEFYSRRVRRIFPALIIVLAGCLVAGWFLLFAGEYRQLGEYVAGGAGFVSNFIMWKESGYFDNAAATKPLLHLWSLGIEEQFYIVWPLLLWSAQKKNYNWLTIISSIIVASFVWNVSQAKPDPIGDFYSPLTRFWELLAGALLAHFSLNKVAAISVMYDRLDRWLGVAIYQNAPEPDGTTRRNVASILGATLIIIGLITITGQTRYPSAAALLPTLGAAFIIEAGPNAWLNRQILGRQILVWIGLISYPLYLWHWPLLSFARIVEAGTLSATIRSAIVVASIVAAWLTYKIVEKPMRLPNRAGFKAIGLTAVMTIVGAAGYAVFATGGFPFRIIAKDMAALSNYDYLNGTADHFWENSCLNIKETFETFERNGCEQEQFPNHKKVVLVGDSHAAHLGLGLRKYLTAREFNLFQVTVAFCTPFAVDDEKERCRDINRHAVELIGKQKPDIIILFAYYMQYAGAAAIRNVEKTDFEKLLLQTTNNYIDLGVKRVIVVGQIPIWPEDLPKILFRKYILKRKAVPDRTYDGIKPESLDWDERLANLPYPTGVTYVSLKGLLCNVSGCLTKTGPNLKTDLIVWDYGHLTESGADYITQNLLSRLIQ